MQLPSPCAPPGVLRRGSPVSSVAGEKQTGTRIAVFAPLSLPTEVVLKRVLPVKLCHNLRFQRRVGWSGAALCCLLRTMTGIHLAACDDATARAGIIQICVE